VREPSRLARDERFALVLAALLHLTLVCWLASSPSSRPIDSPPERMSVTLTDTVALSSASPQPKSGGKAEIAPELGASPESELDKREDARTSSPAPLAPVFEPGTDQPRPHTSQIPKQAQSKVPEPQTIAAAPPPVPAAPSKLALAQPLPLAKPLPQAKPNPIPDTLAAAKPPKAVAPKARMQEAAAPLPAKSRPSPALPAVLDAAKQAEKLQSVSPPRQSAAQSSPPSAVQTSPTAAQKVASQEPKAKANPAPSTPVVSAKAKPPGSEARPSGLAAGKTAASIPVSPGPLSRAPMTEANGANKATGAKPQAQSGNRVGSDFLNGLHAARPAQSPSGASRLGSDFLKGVSANQAIEEAKGTLAPVIGPAVQSALAGAISRQLKPYWAAPQGVDAEKLVTILAWNLGPDGQLVGSPRIVRQEGMTQANSAQAARHAEQAIRAVQLAAPFDLPSEHYEAWRRIATFRFDRKLSL